MRYTLPVIYFGSIYLYLIILNSRLHHRYPAICITAEKKEIRIRAWRNTYVSKLVQQILKSGCVAEGCICLLQCQ